MDHAEREARIARVSKLLRVREFIKCLKNEAMTPASLDLLKTAFADAMILRNIVQTLAQMDNVESESAQDQYSRYSFMYLKNYLIEKIETALSFLESQTNVLHISNSAFSILEDLERATLIFRMRVGNYVAVLPEKTVKKDK